VAATAEKGLYAARKALNRHNSIPFKLATRTFNTLLQPILLYGCEVWGTSSVANVINKAGTKFIKQILGVAQSAPNSAVLLETERYPIKMRVLKYWLNLCEIKNRREIQKRCLDYQMEQRNTNS